MRDMKTSIPTMNPLLGGNTLGTLSSKESKTTLPQGKNPWVLVLGILNLIIVECMLHSRLVLSSSRSSREPLVPLSTSFKFQLCFNWIEP